MLKRIWNFIWHDDSFLSWIVNIVLALILVKFVIYPGLGFIFDTTHPLVAVVSGSMEHNNLDFNEWWLKNGPWYENHDIKKDSFALFSFKNGFGRGDIMILRGTNKLEVGDVVVFMRNDGAQVPVIHRIVVIDGRNRINYSTKGDNNYDRDPWTVDKILGKAILRIPYLGYVKIFFVDSVLTPFKRFFL